MRAFHDSRNCAFRNPYGAVTPNTPVRLAIDVWDAPDATVALRTWVDGIGERVYDMRPTQTGGATSGGATADATSGAATASTASNAAIAAEVPEGATRYEIAYTPDAAGIVWYHFVITDCWGNTQRYGARDGLTGGKGQMRDWEPPSFQLSVHAEGSARKKRDGKAGSSKTDTGKACGGDICYHVFPSLFFGAADASDGAEADDALEQKLDYLESFGVTMLQLDPRDMPGHEGLFDRVRAAVEARGMTAIVDDGMHAASYEQLCADIADPDAGMHVGFGLASAAGTSRCATTRRRSSARAIKSRPLTNTQLMDAIVSFVRNERSAFELAELIESQRENYPARAFGRFLNPIGAPERARLMTQFGSERNVAEIPAHERADFKLDDGHRGLGKGRLWCASLIQMLMPGIPTLYFGDEAGMEGFARYGEIAGCDGASGCGMTAAGWTDGGDGMPGETTGDGAASGTFPWDAADQDCAAIVHNTVDMKHSLPLFANGAFACFAANDDVFGIWRRGGDGQAVCLLINSSLRNAYDIAVPMAGEMVSEVIGGYGVPIVGADEVKDLDCAPSAQAATGAAGAGAGAAGAGAGAAGADARSARVHINQLGSVILYFHDEQLLERPMEPGIGVLAHITSLPVDETSGFELPAWYLEADDALADDEAADAEAEGEVAGADSDATGADSEAAGANDNADSEATGAAPFPFPFPEQLGTLGAPARWFVDWLAEAGVRYWQVLPVNPTDGYGSPYAGISAFAGNTRLLEQGSDDAAIDKLIADNTADYQAFCEREQDWLEPYACFMAIRQKLDTDATWQEWPKKYRKFNPKQLEKDAKLREFAETWRRSQFAFEQQWHDLRSYANARGIQIIGDMPIYVSSDSADVWGNPKIFQLGPDGKPEVVAGCPPDSFAVDGQIWGNPVYDWNTLARDGYGWWMRRLERAFELYDIVRLDHFIGFARYFSIPAGEKATAGFYRPGPGLSFFRVARDKFGPLPVIAEDLGSITPAVRTLVAACGFPGMDIVQFVDGNDPLSGYQPRPDKIAYTGTHDNQTLVGYCRNRYPELDAVETADQLIEKVVCCSAPVRVLPLQDLLGLDDAARMNVPGTAKGNWIWQARRCDIEAALSRTRELVGMQAFNQETAL